jgi:hypothetical protein
MAENQGSEKGIHHSLTQVMFGPGEPPAALNRPKGTNSRQPQKKLIKLAVPFRQ